MNRSTQATLTSGCILELGGAPCVSYLVLSRQSNQRPDKSQVMQHSSMQGCTCIGRCTLSDSWSVCPRMAHQTCARSPSMRLMKDGMWALFMVSLLPLFKSSVSQLLNPSQMLSNAGLAEYMSSQPASNVIRFSTAHPFQSVHCMSISIQS